MRVKLIKNKVVSTENAKVINSDLSESLKVGMSFYVFAIEVSSEATYFYIFDDYYLFPVPSVMFDIIDNDMPSQWKIVRRDESLYICPELFNEPYFYDRFSDHDKELSDKFKIIAAEMYPEYEYKEW